MRRRQQGGLGLVEAAIRHPDCMVRRIGGRKSHPEFHRVQSMPEDSKSMLQCNIRSRTSLLQASKPADAPRTSGIVVDVTAGEGHQLWRMSTAVAKLLSVAGRVAPVGRASGRPSITAHPADLPITAIHGLMRVTGLNPRTTPWRAGRSERGEAALPIVGDSPKSWCHKVAPHHPLSFRRP
jgi:hypothetical protein